ncbi:protein of unknown function [Noviherbaspirillum humi]|uniref:DUF4124 domain-containing protein n=2 Tax=Noviherbaspirillum humi TaxID=1688639 RepID=A0A239H7Y5_9BURK|nr:protein of unknown function [Noviherbaspirillum humi]
MKNLLQKIALSGTALLALSASLSASAQYAWTDERGVRQYSDRPPPPDVSASRIHKAPGGAKQHETRTGVETASADAVKPGTDAAAEGADKKKQPQTIAERNAEFQKRRIEAAEQEKKRSEQEADAASRARNCERIRGYQKTLEAGGRVARLDKNGERNYLSEEQVQQELRETRDMAARCAN